MDFTSYKMVKGARTPLPLYKYLETPPKDVFYDFACQLSEYCLNREPDLLKKTRFWHDLFHAIGHKCGICFKSSRVCGLEGINTEICEQVNAFLQCIKYTAAHLQSYTLLLVQKVPKTRIFKILISHFFHIDWVKIHPN